MILAAVLAFVTLQRLAEAWYAQRNARALLARGAIEAAPKQHAWFIALHAAWLLAMWLFIPHAAVPNWLLLGVFAVLQLMRVWVLATLGSFWTTRIVTLPDAPLVRSGPYRLMRHPNYAIVCAELAVLPLAFGAWQIALLFTVLNALLLRARIRAENVALAPRERL